MASYGLKYYADYHKGATQIRVEVHEKDYTGSVYYMATIQSLTLEIGGGSEPIYTPVVKTTVRFSLADAFDKGSTVGGVECVTTEDGVLSKHGRWEEFYTNDATRYKVVLRTNNAIIWQGFITPDSWEEAMVYRGSITVVARDMLGTLQDVTFNPETADGTISVGDLISDAITVSQAAMDVLMMSANVPWNLTKEVSIFSARLRVAAFEDRSWWEALTATLEALGLVLRYDGAGGWKVVAVRYIPTLSSGSHVCEFTDRSGLRTLDPPVRDIDCTFTVESDEYQLQPYDATRLIADELIFSDGGIFFEVQSYKLSEDSGSWSRKISERPSLLYRPILPASSELREAGFTGFSDMYFLGNTSSQPYTIIGGRDQYKALGEASIISGKIKAAVKLVIRQDGLILTQGNGKLTYATPLGNDPAPYVGFIELYIVADVDGSALFYQGDGEWSEMEQLYRMEFSGGEGAVDIIAPEGVDDADYFVSLAYVRVDPEYHGAAASDNPNYYGTFVPLAFYLAYPDGADVASEYNVRTLYNEDYNVRITRTPALGCVDTALAGAFLKNALLHGDAPIPDRWGWYNENIEVPLEVLVQMQLLQFYASPASVFTGTLHEAPAALPGAGYRYFDRSCVLLRGTYDFAAGMIRGAALREFYTWNQVWGSTEPHWTRRTKGSTEGSGGSGSGGSGGSGDGSESYANTMAIAAMRARIEALEDFWDKDSDGNIFAKNQAGVYSYTFMTGGGKGTSGGGGGSGADVQLSVAAGVATLTVNGTTAAMYTKAGLDGRLGAAAYKGVGRVASGDTDLVTGAAVYAAIQAHGGQANVQANWAETDANSDAYIRNKPELATVATSGSYADLSDKPAIPSAPGTLNTDLSTSQSVSSSESLSGPIRLHKVSKTGSYTDLLSRPTKLSDFENDGFVTLGTAQTISGQKTFSTNVLPASISQTLGDASHYWGSIYLKANGSINVGTTEVARLQSGLIMSKALLPYTAGSDYLGTTERPWLSLSLLRYIYLVRRNGDSYESAPLFGRDDSQIYIGSVALTSWGLPTAVYASKELNFHVRAEGATATTHVLQLQADKIVARQHLLPLASNSLDLGTGDNRWRNLHVKRWYPNGASDAYIEFDTTTNAFHIVGAVYADGFVSAGAANPNA